MNFSIDSGKRIFSLIIMQKSKLDLTVGHGWDEFSFLVKYCQVYNDHNEQDNQNNSISVELIHEDFQT